MTGLNVNYRHNKSADQQTHYLKWNTFKSIFFDYLFITLQIVGYNFRFENFTIPFEIIFIEHRSIEQSTLDIQSILILTWYEEN